MSRKSSRISVSMICPSLDFFFSLLLTWFLRLIAISLLALDFLLRFLHSFLWLFIFPFRYKTLDGRTQNELVRARLAKELNSRRPTQKMKKERLFILFLVTSTSCHSRSDSDKPSFKSIILWKEETRDAFNKAFVLIAFLFSLKAIDRKGGQNRERSKHRLLLSIT